MSAKRIALGELIVPAKVPRAGDVDFPILSMTMHGGLVDQSEKFKKRIASADTSNYKVVSAGQLVIGFPIDEGVLSFQSRYEKAIVSPAYEVWDVRPEHNTHRPYLERFLRSPDSLSFYRGKLKSTTARRRTVPRETFLSLLIPLPPLPEQKRIAAILDHADELRRKRQRAIDRLNQLGQAIFYEMFGDPASNPMGWPIGKINDLAASTQYGTSAKAGAEGAYAILRMGNVTTSGDIDLASLKYIDFNRDEVEKYTVSAGDILFNRTNSPDLVGKTAVYHGDRPFGFAGYLIRLRTNHNAVPEYLSAFLNSPFGKKVLRNMCKAIIGMANINAKELRSIALPVPPIEKQREFQKKLSSIRDVYPHLNASGRGLDGLFSSLQHRAFRGEL